MSNDIYLILQDVFRHDTLHTGMTFLDMTLNMCDLQVQLEIPFQKSCCMDS